jgi:hypothetical protein
LFNIGYKGLSSRPRTSYLLQRGRQIQRICQGLCYTTLGFKGGTSTCTGVSVLLNWQSSSTSSGTFAFDSIISLSWHDLSICAIVHVPRRVPPLPVQTAEPVFDLRQGNADIRNHVGKCRGPMVGCRSERGCVLSWDISWARQVLLPARVEDSVYNSERAYGVSAIPDLGRSHYLRKSTSILVHLRSIILMAIV